MKKKFISTYLIVNAYEYQCDNSSCDITIFAMNVDGFLNYYSRMTESCEDFICTLALETSCKGSARICRSMNLKTSGDSIIRLLTKRYLSQQKFHVEALLEWMMLQFTKVPPLKQSKTKRHYKNMTTFHEALYSVTFGWE